MASRAHFGTRIRAGDDDFGDACHLRGHGAHQHTRGIACLAAGRVDAHARERRHSAAEGDSLFRVFEATQGIRLALMVAANACSSLDQRFGDRLRQAVECRLAAVVAFDPSWGHALLEALDVAFEGNVALAAHRAQYFAHRGFDAIQVTLTPTGKTCQELVVLRRALGFRAQRCGGGHVQCPALSAAGSYSRIFGPRASRKTCSSSMSMSSSGKPLATSMPTARMRRNMAKLEAHKRGFHCSVPLIAV